MAKKKRRNVSGMMIAWVWAYLQVRGWPTSVEMVCDGLGVRKLKAYRALAALVEAGWVQKVPRLTRDGKRNRNSCWYLIVNDVDARGDRPW